MTSPCDEVLKTLSLNGTTSAAVGSPPENVGLANSAELAGFIDRALAEDIGTGDITGQAVVPEGAISSATLLLKEPGVIAGLLVFEAVLRRCEPQMFFEARAVDSQRITQAPFCLAQIKGRARALLAAERVALNLIQRMCGIATFTAGFAELAAPFGIEILDTRKTTPCMRFLEKYAVRLGGGTNHRFGLYDSILIKDNHRAIAGGVSAAVNRVRALNSELPVEVEVNTLEQLQEALDLRVERVMLDNMTPDLVKKSVELAAGRTYIEVSGGVSLKNIRDYLIKGVNGISIGALTHSVKNIDISLEFED